MQEHISDEQLSGVLANQLGTGTHDAMREHLVACRACREEEQRLREFFARYRQALLDAAERPEGFWNWQESAIAERLSGRRTARRLVWAGALAMVAFFGVLSIEKRAPSDLIIAEDPDHVLLMNVERSVRRDLPRALEPAALLTQEMDRAAEVSANP